MRVLLTGASGFLGSHLGKYLGPDLITLGRGLNNGIVVDLSIQAPILPEVDFIVHNAGLAHKVPKNPKEEKKFFDTNVIGTSNLLKGIDRLANKPHTFVFISSVAVYGLDFGELISEDQITKPQTAYGKSKLEAEKLLQEYCAREQINLTILRLPLVVGRNLPGNLGAMVNSIRRGFYFKIKGLEICKSMVLADDVGKLIPKLSESSGIYNLTDGIHPTLAQLELELSNYFNKPIYQIPILPVKLAAKFGDIFSSFPINSYRLNKLSQSLTFDDRKARKELDWAPSSVLENLTLLL